MLKLLAGAILENRRGKEKGKQVGEQNPWVEMCLVEGKRDSAGLGIPH